MRAFSILGVLLALASGPALASGALPADGYFTITPITSPSTEYDYALPLVSKLGAEAVARKINLTVQLLVVQRWYERVGEGLFDDLCSEEGYGVTRLSYTVLCNSPTLLSLRFSDETMGSYPDYHTYYLTFNALTGDLIALPELLTPAGIDRIHDLANSRFNEDIKRILMDDPHGIESETLERVFALTECNANQELERFGCTTTALMVEKGRCFPHSMQAQDIAWRHTIPYTALFTRVHVTDYGRQLLLEGEPDSATYFLRKQNRMALHGKIDGKYEFTLLLLFSPDGSVSGYYWYPKVGTLIDFEGRRSEGGKIVLTEANGQFVLTLHERSIAGVWANEKGESFPIVFY